MLKFDYSSFPEKMLTPEVTGLLAAIHEYKGKQEFFTTARPDVLNSLLEIAKIQSTEASNRIEGIQTSDARLRALVAKNAIPRNRNEQEIAGYRDVLNTIHTSYEFIPLRPDTILQFHRDLYAALPPGRSGHWKNSDNVITETDANGRSVIRFRPMSAVETPLAMERLCTNFNDAIQARRHDPLLLTSLFILDFLCIHPFDDGNGRMSRLLTLLLLYQAGYIVGKYISIEKQIELSKATYYETLREGSVGWSDGRNDPAAFVGYQLGVILKAYREFENRVQLVISRKATKADRIRAVFETKAGKFSKRDIRTLCPDISEAMIEKTLKALVDAGFIRKTAAAGRDVSYYKN